MEYVLLVFKNGIVHFGPTAAESWFKSGYPHQGLFILSSVPHKKKTPWSESASELYQPSDRLLLAKRLPTFADRGCHVVSVTDPYGRILGFLNELLLFYQVAPQLYSRG
jgi:hypothetical protein